MIDASFPSIKTSARADTRTPAARQREDERGVVAGALGNTTKFTDEFVPALRPLSVENQRVREFLNPETGEIFRFEEDRNGLKAAFDRDAAVLESWLLQRHAQRILSRPQHWQQRAKVQPSPYTDLTAKVVFCDIETRKEVKVLAHKIGQPVVRMKNNALVSGELYSDISTREVHSTDSFNKAPTFRVVSCRRSKVPGKQPELFKAKDGGSVTFHNLAVCGSVWTCPLCSAKINRARREQIAQAYNALDGTGAAAYMLTFTVKHGAGDDLASLLARMKDAMQLLQKSHAWKEVTRSKALKRPRSGSLPFLGYVGRVSALEVTHGKNGWHPHEHQLWFFRREISSAEILQIRDRLFDAWATACVAVGLPAPLKTIKVGNTVRSLGIDVRRALSASEYLTKFGSERERRWGPEKELASSHIKAGRAKGKTPFQILEDAANGCVASAQRFQDFASAFLGRHQLQFSRTLKAFLADIAAMQVDDSEHGDQVLAATLDSDADLIGTLDDDQFDRIVSNKAHAQVLVIARNHGFEQARRFIETLPGKDALRARDRATAVTAALIDFAKKEYPPVVWDKTSH